MHRRRPRMSRCHERKDRRPPLGDRRLAFGERGLRGRVESLECVQCGEKITGVNLSRRVAAPCVALPFQNDLYSPLDLLTLYPT